MKHIFSKTLIFSLLIFYWNQTITEETDKVITLFVQEYPEENNNKIEDNTNCDEPKINLINGIFATYAGYITNSDKNGQITFPRRTKNNSFNLLITNQIYPIFMFQATIAFWQLASQKAKMYKIEKKQDEETELFYWQVQERNLPESKQVPIHTVTILADPKDIYVPTGLTLTNKSNQVILPDIYVKKNLDIIKNTLFVLTIKNFFSQIKKTYQERPLGYRSHILP